jgi:predicted nucleic acid-binding protein
MNHIAEQRYYFDTNALLKYYNPLLKQFEEEEGVLRIRRLVSNSSVPILISPMSSLELVGKVTAFFRQNKVNKKTLRTITTHLRKDIGVNTSRPFKMVKLPENVFRLAETILLEQAQFAISSNDALHLAIVKKQPYFQAIMVTSDHSLQRVCEQTQVPFYDPEQDPF